VYIEQQEKIKGSAFWPSNWLPFLQAWSAYARIELKLSAYETWLYLRRIIGMKPVVGVGSVTM
jgi:hypothetical protein